MLSVLLQMKPKIMEIKNEEMIKERMLQTKQTESYFKGTTTKRSVQKHAELAQKQQYAEQAVKTFYVTFLNGLCYKNESPNKYFVTALTSQYFSLGT